jgi:hypothetical protein
VIEVFARIFREWWIAYWEVRARYESATREIDPDEDDKARTARIAAAIRGMSAQDRPPG